MAGLLFSLHQFNQLRKFFTVALCLALVTVTACSSRTLNDPAPAEVRQVTDEAGRPISVPLKVTRYISLAPNVTEILFAIGAGNGLVGRTTFCNYPAEALKVETVGDTLKPSIERIIALRPQVVFVSTASQLEAFTAELQAHQIAVFVTDAHDLEGVFNSIKNIAEVLGKQQQAEELLKQLRGRVSVVEAKVKAYPPVRVFYQVSAEPLYTIGRDAFLTDVIKRAGGVSVTADVPGAWPRYSDESALAARPDAIILPTGGSMGETNSKPASALERSPAVAHDRVYKINPDLPSRPGPRSVDCLEELARAFHPKAFEK